MIDSIKYNSKISPFTKNYVIFISNLSQLKNIDFIINVDSYLKDKDFVNKIISHNYSIISNIMLNNNKIGNVIICLIDPKNERGEYGTFIFDYFNSIKETNICFIFSDLIILKFKTVISHIIFKYLLKSYNFKRYKNNNKISENKLLLNLYKIKRFKELEQKLHLLQAINLTKDLVSEPANILNPISYAEKCLKLKINGLKIKVLNKNQLQKIGMRSLLGVSQGSQNEPRVVIFEWNLKDNIKPTILAGKGVTFDSGGISLKSSNGMDEMIADMGGSAVIVGSMLNLALNRSAKSIVGIIGLVENMPDGKAQRPGDIIQSLSGQTIEILNTDAEGRLVLADILTYVQYAYKPKEIIDFATLTGAIMVALGTHKAGLFSNNDKLANKLELSGNISGERLWRLPLSEEYDQEIDSARADMKNIGTSKFGGSIHAAQFIKRFINDEIPWAHLDIAGVSWSIKSDQSKSSKMNSPGATAFGVRLIDQFLKGK